MASLPVRFLANCLAVDTYSLLSDAPFRSCSRAPAATATVVCRRCRGRTEGGSEGGREGAEGPSLSLSLSLADAGGCTARLVHMHSFIKIDKGGGGKEGGVVDKRPRRDERVSVGNVQHVDGRNARPTESGPSSAQKQRAGQRKKNNSSCPHPPALSPSPASPLLPSPV